MLFFVCFVLPPPPCGISASVSLSRGKGTVERQDISDVSASLPGMWGWWGLVASTEATAALQSPPIYVMGADRDQTGHKCAPKWQGRCTLWCTLRGLSSDHGSSGWGDLLDAWHGVRERLRQTDLYLTAEKCPWVSQLRHNQWHPCLLSSPCRDDARQSHSGHSLCCFPRPPQLPRPLQLANNNCTLTPPCRGAARLDVALRVQRRWVAGNWVNETVQKQSSLSKDNIPPSFLSPTPPPGLPYSYSRCFCLWKDIYHFSIFDGRFFSLSCSLILSCPRGLCYLLLADTSLLQMEMTLMECGWGFITEMLFALHKQTSE